MTEEKGGAPLVDGSGAAGSRKPRENAEPISPIYRTDKQNVKHFAKILTYPGGVCDIIASSSPDFGPQGWQKSENFSHPGRVLPKKAAAQDRGKTEPTAEDLERSMRRARAKVRRLALSNNFRWFVTLTLDPSKVDTMDGAAVVKKLNAWASNMVQRHGLCYILVPERHKKGGIHFHGFFNDCLKAVDSGHIDRQGHKVYNLPQWSLGFTTAIELYGDYPRAVAYVCKYIGKQEEKPAGRWYYSGGALQEPRTEYAELSPAQLVEQYGEKAYEVEVPGRKLVVVNGIEDGGGIGFAAAPPPSGNVLEQVHSVDSPVNGCGERGVYQN